jgi:hypothetical protein
MLPVIHNAFIPKCTPPYSKVSDSMKIIVDVAMEFCGSFSLCFGTIIYHRSHAVRVALSTVF